jgi:hypothetical protein
MTLDNLRPHKPTFVSAVVVVVLLIVVYHFTLGKRR